MLRTGRRRRAGGAGAGRRTSRTGRSLACVIQPHGRVRPRLLEGATHARVIHDQGMARRVKCGSWLAAAGWRCVKRTQHSEVARQRASARAPNGSGAGLRDGQGKRNWRQGRGKARWGRAHQLCHCGLLVEKASSYGLPAGNTKGYASTYPAMGFANVRAGTQKRRARVPFCIEGPRTLSRPGLCGAHS